MKKTLRNLIGAGMIALSSCKYIAPPIPEDVGNTPESIMEWMYENIAQVPDLEGEDYMQTPRETLDRRAGDCEDFAKLMEYFVEERCGGDAKMIRLIIPNNADHIILEYKNRWYDPMNNNSIPINGDLTEGVHWVYLR